MKTLPRMGLAALAVVLPLSLATPLQAQEQCTATVLPLQVAAGNVAQRINVSMSQAIGNVTSFDAGEDSGLGLADPSDLPRVNLAAGAEQPTPIQMANEGNRATIWLNTVDVEPGEYEFSLAGADGECQGSLTIAASR